MSASQATLSPRRLGELEFLEELRLRGWTRLLFLECGDGWIAEEACRRILKGYVCGVDRSPQLIVGAAELRGVPGRLEFKTWDGRQLPYRDACFDSVVWRCDAGDWPEPLGVLREIRRVVRVGGEVHVIGISGDGASDWHGLLRQAGFLLDGAQSPQILHACCLEGPAHLA